MRQAPRSPLSFKLQRVANVPEHPPPSTRLMSCAHIANRRLSRIIGASKSVAFLNLTLKLLLAPVDNVEVIVSEPAPLLLGSALELLPVPLDSIPVHSTLLF